MFFEVKYFILTPCESFFYHCSKSVLLKAKQKTLVHNTNPIVTFWPQTGNYWIFQPCDRSSGMVVHHLFVLDHGEKEDTDMFYTDNWVGNKFQHAQDCRKRYGSWDLQQFWMCCIPCQMTIIHDKVNHLLTTTKTIFKVQHFFMLKWIEWLTVVSCYFFTIHCDISHFTCMKSQSLAKYLSV